MDLSPPTLTKALGKTGQRELRLWLLAAVAALAISGLFALVAFASRVPAVTDALPFMLDFFGRGLVIHVIYSFVIWFLFVLAAFGIVYTHRLAQVSEEPVNTRLGQAAFWTAAGGSILLLVPSFNPNAEPSLNNYVPVITHPAYYGALILIFGAVMAIGLRFSFTILSAAIALMKRGAEGDEEKALLRNPVGLTFAAFWAFGIALMGLAFAGLSLGPELAGILDGTLQAATNEALFWGFGHILQFVNVALLAASWAWLAGNASARVIPSTQRYPTAILALIASAFIGLAVYFFTDSFSASQTQAFTNLQYLLGPVPVFFGLIIGASLLKNGYGDEPGARFKVHVFWLAFGLFLLGGAFGLFVDGQDTRTPAHYHGSIGAVTLTFMGLILAELLPLTGRTVRLGKTCFVLIWAYALGQAMHATGLFIKGGYGAPRKTAGAIEGLDGAGVEIGQLLFRTGAPLAILAGVAFVVIAGRALVRKTPPNE